MEEIKSKVYIKVDEQRRILRCEGGYTMQNISDVSEWTLIDEGTGDKYNLCQAHYFDGGLYTMDGIPRFKWDSSAVVLRSDEELEADRAAILESKPSKTVEARLTALEAEAEQAKADREALNILLGGAE